jgi:hypothetical protein
MRLIGPKALLLISLAAIACSDTTSPTIAGIYVLRSVDGRELPAPIPSPIPEFTTVLAGIVTLHTDGTATIMERTRPFDTSTEETSTKRMTYDLDGNNIVLFWTDCPPNALCIPISGVLFGSMLSLNVAPFTENGLMYVYHRAAE